MSDTWSSPDPRRVVTGTAFGQPYARSESVSPPVARDVLAGVVTLAVTILAGAPVGLLWAALAPRAEAVLSGQQYLRADVETSAYIAGDGFFLAAGLVAGVVTGLLAWRLARAHGPAVVPALAVGGAAAAYVAMRVGEQVGIDALAQAVRTATPRVDLTLQLGALATLAAWPVAALVAHLVATLLTKDASVQADGSARQLR